MVLLGISVVDLGLIKLSSHVLVSVISRIRSNTSTALFMHCTGSILSRLSTSRTSYRFILPLQFTAQRINHNTLHSLDQLWVL